MKLGLNFLKIKSGSESKRFLFSVGLKMMIGVGLISNLCIGFLLYVNITSFLKVSEKTSELFQQNDLMNENLRSRITELQTKYLEIPKHLSVDPADKIMDWVTANYIEIKKEKIEGRENYRGLFNRSQRRDVSKGNFVVSADSGSLVLSKGVVNADGEFQDAVSRFYLESTDPEKDAERINGYLEFISNIQVSQNELELKVFELKSLLADEAIEAEKSRNEILYKVEEIAKKRAELGDFKNQKLRTIALIAGMTVILNLIILHFMSWVMVEKPLKKLTVAIESISKDEPVKVPYQKRKDRIGILSSSVKAFQSALTDLKSEDERKKKEAVIIQGLLKEMTRLIESLLMKADAMKTSASRLSRLASETKDQTLGATASASKTVEQTDKVSESTKELQTAVHHISGQVATQNRLVKDINSVTRKSMEDIKGLSEASSQINDIVNIVKNIAKETKLLALNARIEAARSGEAGKGFTVVAREVRALSDQTENANEEIAAKVDSIIQASRKMIKNTGLIETQIEQLVRAGDEISNTVNEQGTVTGGIAVNAQATVSDIKDVSDRISQVEKTASDTSRFAQDVEALTGEISSELSALLAGTREKLSRVGASNTVRESLREMETVHVEGNPFEIRDAATASFGAA